MTEVCTTALAGVSWPGAFMVVGCALAAAIGFVGLVWASR
jgi:hypothetical protein